MSKRWSPQGPPLQMYRSLRCSEAEVNLYCPAAGRRRYRSDSGCLFGQITEFAGVSSFSPRSGTSGEDLPTAPKKVHAHSCPDRFTLRGVSVERPCWSLMEGRNGRGKKREGTSRRQEREVSKSVGSWEREEAEKEEDVQTRIQLCLLF